MNAYVFFFPLFFLCLIKVIQSKCSQTCLLKPAWLYSLLADLQNKKLLVTADSYSTKHPRVLSPLSLSWAEFKAHQPLVCVTLIVPIRAEQGHAGHVSMMSLWEECGSTPLATVYNSTLCPPLPLVYTSPLAVCSSSSLDLTQFLSSKLNYLLLSQFFTLSSIMMLAC